ncbi:hypothetical protein WMF20_30905 [Sorangium sp. So ce834]|uniref:hypothetical protein n=1 Tax=Sorangium sp. So ce834 TaxID=3133321 RepID=UPI003F60F594
MRITRARYLSPALLLIAGGCGTAPGPNDTGGTACEGASSCQGEAPPESVCLESLAAGVLEDGCGVFVGGFFGSGDDANPGTRDKPLRTLQRGVELARTGRGRVFACNDGFFQPLTLPSGVDLIGGFHCLNWERFRAGRPLLQGNDENILLTVVPASADDTGAADGVSTIVDMGLQAAGPITMLVQSNTVVEFIRSMIHSSSAWGGRDGEEWPWPYQAATGLDGVYGGDACSAATVAGGAAAMRSCDDGLPSMGGKGGDGKPEDPERGDDGMPIPMPNPTNSGRGGSADRENVGCSHGFDGAPGDLGTLGAAGEGIGRISEAGWEGGRAGDGSRGMPGQGGGGGGGRRGGLAACGVASKGGAGGGSGGAGGCGGRGGRGGENGYPTIGIIALHARLTVRDSEIMTLEAGPGGDGGEPERGGKGGRGQLGGAVGDGTWSCSGGDGGPGGEGGYGGPGRGGDSIGIAYLDEDQLTLENVTYELGPPGKGGTSWDWSGTMVTGEDGIAVETLRFPD